MGHEDLSQAALSCTFVLALPVQAQGKSGQNGRQLQHKRVPSSPKLVQEEVVLKTRPLFRCLNRN